MTGPAPSSGEMSAKLRAELLLVAILVAAAGLFPATAGAHLGIETPSHLHALPGIGVHSDLLLGRASLHGIPAGGDAAFYAVVACVLLVPWVILGLMVVGHLRSRWARKAGPGCTAVSRQVIQIATGGSQGDPWLPR